MKYRAGLIGCGRIGCGFDDDPNRGYVSTHAGAYVQTPGVNLVALADMDETKLVRYGDKFRVGGRYTDCMQMLDRERLDILSVCTWSDTHLDIVRAAAERGVKAVFCEKPMADTLSAADEMIRLCAERGVLLMIDHQRRFDPTHQRIAAYIKSGALGRIQQVTCYYTAGVANTGSHLFDLLRFCLGDVRWTQGRYSQNVSPNPQDPNIDAILGFDSGCLAVLQACDVKAYLIFELAFLGTRGRLRITSSGFDVVFEAAQDSPRFAGYKELAPAASPVRPEGQPEFMLHGVAHLLECLKSGQKPISSGEDGRAALEIICALRESADANGRLVELPLKSSPVTINSR